MYRILLTAVLACGTSAAGQSSITLDSLLTEMTDRSALARLPDPAYTCRQASSYDRASTEPGSLDSEGRLCNGDVGQYLRIEERNGRKEHVMMDAAGPGAVVRIWSANPKGTLRVYLDSAAEPVIEAPMDQVLGGKTVAPPPLSQSCSKGWNLYLPIPYAKRCLITSDEGGFYYQVNYRTYEPGARVESASASQLESLKPRIEETCGQLTEPDNKELGDGVILFAGKTLRMPPKPDRDKTGPEVIKRLSLRLQASDLARALRSVILEMDFDGETTVWCPVGDFFAQVGGNTPWQSWPVSVSKNGTMTSRWAMPFRESSVLRVTNLTDEPIRVAIESESSGWTWDSRSMHFHAAWTQTRSMHTRPMRDWNYINITGRGVVVGDNLAVVNPVKDWWGEGDEKIYVDGETFPSHFGTGTEDYYGYAWCDPTPFMAPFHAQVRCDGPGNYGRTTVTRLRSLDAIPFTKSYRQDMEVWHWKECDVTYAGVTYFYALPGATTNVAPMPEEAKLGSIAPTPLSPPMRIAGALEAEDLKVVRASEGMPVTRQDMGGFGHDKWSNNAHLWGQGRKVGDFIELTLHPHDDNGFNAPATRRVVVHATKSWDYGIVQFYVNGKPAGKPVDLFSGAQGRCEPTGPIDLGVFTSQSPAPDLNQYVLRVEVVGGNEKALGSRSFFAIDAIKLEPVK